ncbi:hypothetical protein B0O99DRAFT_691617 [Bisporella sp. PMI_857]|nr:hypothetical protein B0O99DRAFT_691617 [Bisporella sp. PMI_857]
MPAATASSLSPIQGAAQESDEIRVTTAIEQQIRFDINDLAHLPLSNGSWKSWKSCYVLADQIEPKYSDWYQIKSARGLHIVGKCCNGKFYEVAVHESYIPWLLRHDFDFLPCLDDDVDVDRAEPTDAEIRVHGIPAAQRRARDSFLLNIINAIKSGNSPGLVSYFRHIVPLPLRISLEWAILSHEILESDPQIRNKFCFCLLLIALSLNHDYSCPTVVELLEKNQDKLFQDFRKVYIDLLDTTASKQILQFHFIALVRALFTFCGGRKDFLQEEFYLGNTVSQNADFFGYLVGITGSHCFGSFIIQDMLKALSLSKAVAKDDVHLLDIRGLVRQMMDSLPIGFPQGYLNIPAKLLYGLGKGEVDQIRVQMLLPFANIQEQN